MNNQKKKFNFFDILVYILIAAILVGVAYFLVSSPKEQTSSNTTLDFVVEVQAGTPDVLSLVNEGDAVTLSGKTEVTIKNVASQPAQRLTLDQNSGKYKNTLVPEKFDIYVTVSGAATQTDKDISVGNTPVKVGMTTSLEGKGYSLNGTVIDMTLFDENGEEIKND
ncbi:MAG: DUF4330 domain-containing protein [Ruminococcaceae bacterium]|nr:DUF4330 domain-containing protein [Oscillospiraceae bacterium]